MENEFACQSCGKPTKYNYGAKYEMVCKDCADNNIKDHIGIKPSKYSTFQSNSNALMKAIIIVIALVIVYLIFVNSNLPNKPKYQIPDIVAVINSNSNWSGYFLNRTVDGKGDQIVELGNVKIISIIIQKQDAYRGELSGYILDRANNKKLSETVSTTADYGVITLTAINDLYDE